MKKILITVHDNGAFNMESDLPPQLLIFFLELVKAKVVDDIVHPKNPVIVEVPPGFDPHKNN